MALDLAFPFGDLGEGQWLGPAACLGDPQGQCVADLICKLGAVRHHIFEPGRTKHRHIRYIHAAINWPVHTYCGGALSATDETHAGVTEQKDAGMSKNTKDELAPLVFWAVGRFADAAEVAIRLNSFSPIRMSVENAREIAAALEDEADAVNVTRPRSRPAAPSARAMKERK